MTSTVHVVLSKAELQRHLLVIVNSSLVGVGFRSQLLMTLYKQDNTRSLFITILVIIMFLFRFNKTVEFNYKGYSTAQN